MSSSVFIEVPISLSELTTPFLTADANGTQVTNGDQSIPATTRNTGNADLETGGKGEGQSIDDKRMIEAVIPLSSTPFNYGNSLVLGLGQKQHCNKGSSSKSLYCYWCDNLRDVVVIVNVLALIISGIMMYDVVIREKEQQQQHENTEESFNNLISIFWNRIVSTTSDHSSSTTTSSSASSSSSIITYVLGLVLTAFGFIGFPLCGIIGAIKYNKNLVGMTTTWYSLYAMFMILSFHASVWIETVIILLCCVYPHVLLLQEMRINESTTNLTNKT